MCISTVGVRKDLYPKDPNNVRITDFFGSIRPTEISSQRVNVTLANDSANDEAIEQKLDEEEAATPKKYIFYEQFPTELFQ